MNTLPFAIFPWNGPFLPPLQEYVCRCTDNAPGRSVIIVPHNRPRRYLTELFRHDQVLPRPALLPRILTVSEMIGLFRAQTTAPLRTAQSLDRVALLHRAVHMVVQNDAESDLCQRFANMDMAHFFPWGLRLSSLLEECLTQQLEARDIPYTEGEVSPPASALLGALGRIHARYLTLLEEEGWTTPGLDAFVAAREWKQGAMGIPPLLRHEEGIGGRQIFIAGLAVLSDAENTLLHALWKDGAHICLHTDPTLAHIDKGQGHWACVDHVRWMRQWKAKGTLVLPSTENQPHLHFMAGYDVHSQLLAVQQVLAKDTTEQAPSTAIVLTNAGLLMPTLHHLPDRDFNVSMGYPLDRSPLCRLLECIMRLHATARPVETEEQVETRYYWRSLLQCLRHPYIQMLHCPPPPGEKAQALREMLFRMERQLRGGARFATPFALASQAMTDSSNEQRELLQKMLHCCITGFASVRTPENMAEALGALCDLLLSHGGDIWNRYPLDAESLYRLVQHVIPALKSSSLAQTPFPQSALFSLTRQLIQAERVPFEADPIAGLQILGMLETRLLHFDRLLVVDATDDALPGFTAQDPLLPDALRSLLGLPDAQRRERTAAHTLYRLMAGAKDVHFFWQEGIQRSSLFDGKKSRSRFVDECLWQEEQRRGNVLREGQEPLFTAPCPVFPVPRRAQSLPANELLRQKVKEMLTQGISPTKLDAYVQCPQRFAWECLYGFRPLEEVNEGDDFAAVGRLLHEVLHRAYIPWLGQDMRCQDLKSETLHRLWEESLNASSLREQLPPDSYTMLSLSAPLRLHRYLEKQPEETHIVALEQKILTPFISPCGKQYALYGTLDRVDKRRMGSTQGLLVLDYKTGQVHRPPLKAWSDTDLWRDMQLWAPGHANGDVLLDRVATAFPSLQLPCYIHMCRQHMPHEGNVTDACWVALRDKGEEVYLLGDKCPEELRDTVLTTRIPQLLAFVLHHLASAEEFVSRQGLHCTYCPYGALCRK